MKTLFEGEKVVVYEDPITELIEEGEGIVKKVISHHGQYNGRTIYRCMVKFDGDKRHYERKVLT